MDLLQTYSNPDDQVKRLHRLLDLPVAARSRASTSPPKQAQKGLEAEEVAGLVADHQAGAGVAVQAERCGNRREIVRDILRRQGAHRPPGIQPDDIPKIIQLHEDGWSLACLGEKYQVAAGAVSRTIRAPQRQDLTPQRTNTCQ